MSFKIAILLFLIPSFFLTTIAYDTRLTLSLDETKLRFIVMGDWGDDNAEQFKVGSAMGKWCEENKCEFIVALGDNFYNHGVFSADDERFKTTWSNVYEHYGIALLDWYVIVGNHDHGNSASEEDGHEWFQVEHSQIDPRWKFPDLAYSLTVDIETARVKFVNIDTESIRHNVNDPEAMIDFLDNELNNTNNGINWKIVAGHHPCYTASGHFNDGKLIREKVLPIMEKHQTDVYLAGHEHNQQHFQSKDLPEGIDHVITGGGGKPLSPFNQDDYDSSINAGMEMLNFDYNYGFAYLSIDEKSMTWQFINSDLEVVHQYTRTKH